MANLDDRFIPACAGNAAGRSAGRIPPPVHPRVCGERLIDGQTTPTTRGSSPRVRGTLRGKCRSVGISRFIPACAGNALFDRACAVVVAVHPRVCGERYTDSIFILLRCWFIPACAGNASRTAAARAPRTVHPRVCGERLVSGHDHYRIAGSSPRVRGTLKNNETFLKQDRFIPACAGNARNRNVLCLCGTVHPRVCGERFRLLCCYAGAYGSSPRVRGTLASTGLTALLPRFIPACAGNAPSSALQKSYSPVHPRVCGERPELDDDETYQRGSSPRVRGTLDFYL